MDVTGGFRDVDASGRTEAFVSYLDTVAAQAAAMKRGTIEALALQPGDAALDVGCGVGNEVRALAAVVGPTGRAVGFDRSEELLAEARSRSGENPAIEFIAGDAHHLPFADGEFAGARVERALQHMAEPAAAVAEMARAVRSGGRVVAMEPDWDTLTTSGGDREAGREVAAVFAASLRHPNAGALLPGWFVAAGLRVADVTAAAWTCRTAALAEQIFRFGSFVEQVGTPRARSWLEELYAQEAGGGLVAAVTGFVVTGIKP